MSNALVQALRDAMPETYGDDLSDDEVVQKAMAVTGITGVSSRKLQTTLGQRSTNPGRSAARLAQGFGNQAAFGFGSELAEFTAPVVQNLIGAGDYALTALSGGDVSEAAKRWKTAIESDFRDVGQFSDLELQQGREDMPMGMGVSELAGGVAGSAIPLGAPGRLAGVGGRAAASAAGRSAPVANRFGRMMANRVDRAVIPRTLPGQMATGAAEGALFGAGNAPSGQRADAALMGAGLGAVAPAAVRGAIPAAQAVGRFGPTGMLARGAGGFAQGTYEGLRRGYRPPSAAWVGARRGVSSALDPWLSLIRRAGEQSERTGTRAAAAAASRPVPSSSMPTLGGLLDADVTPSFRVGGATTPDAPTAPQAMTPQATAPQPTAAATAMVAPSPALPATAQGAQRFATRQLSAVARGAPSPGDLATVQNAFPDTSPERLFAAAGIRDDITAIAAKGVGKDEVLIDATYRQPEFTFERNGRQYTVRGAQSGSTVSVSQGNRELGTLTLSDKPGARRQMYGRGDRQDPISDALIRQINDEIRQRGPMWYSQERVIRREGEDLVIDNNSFRIRPNGLGMGADIFAYQVENAQRLGARRIETSAAKGRHYNGYYTWARLGYDAPLEPQLQQKYGVDTVQELMALDGGADIWLREGHSFDGVFDLTPGSKSLQVLEDFMQRRAG